MKRYINLYTPKAGFAAIKYKYGGITDKIFLIKKTDVEGQTFETIVSNKSIICIYIYVYFHQADNNLIDFSL